VWFCNVVFKVELLLEKFDKKVFYLLRITTWHYIHSLLATSKNADVSLRTRNHKY